MFYEFDTIKQLDHPNVLKLYEVIEDRNRFHVITEMYTGGELFERIVKSDGNFSELDAAKYTYQICSAMKYCH
jgi:calcium-dependent protein kinase